MQSKATTVAAYLASLPADRRAAISAVRDVILKNLDKGYKEGMQYGMIGYCVPHSAYPAGYHCDPRQPLPFAGLASQKQYMSLYLMGVYCGCEDGKESELARWFRDAWTRTGKKLDMGKACIRFKKIENVPLEVVGEAIRRVPLKAYLAFYEKALVTMAADAAARRAAKFASAPARKADAKVVKKAAVKPRTSVERRSKASTR